jgi:lipopolysaccharide export system permease protein
MGTVTGYAMIKSRRLLPPFCVLDRYVMREFLRYYFLAVGGLVAFVLLMDALEKIDTFIDYDASATEILLYYWNILPYRALIVAPVAPLLATFLALGSMTKFREILSIKSAGFSLYRIFTPIYLIGILLAVVSFMVSEGVMPQANLRARQILEMDIKGRTMRNLGSRINVTYLGLENRRFVIRRYDVPRQMMVDPMIQEFQGERLSRRLDASKAIFLDEGWVLVDGVERRFKDEGIELTFNFDSLRVEFPERPSDFAKAETVPEEMSFPELRKYSERVRQSGSSAEIYETELYLRTAFPFANVVVILIASSLAVQMRRGGVALGFGFSLAIAFLYWSLIRAGQVLGNSGTLPPLLAAWLGNIIFLAVGIYLLFRTPK